MACKGVESKKEELTYSKYLKIEELLRCQHLLTEENTGKGVPEENMFITIHQIFELYFKQILIDMDCVRNLFTDSANNEYQRERIAQHLERIKMIFTRIVDMFPLMETMSPVKFLEFRKYLRSASGFQSLQFRRIENLFGLKQESRVPYHCCNYKEAFRTEVERKIVEESEKEMSLFQLVEKWLETVACFESDGSSLWHWYVSSVGRYLRDQKEAIEDCHIQEERECAKAEVERTEKSFNSITDAAAYADLLNDGKRRLSHKAIQGAMIISLYQETPQFCQCYHILKQLMDIDALILKWRFVHANMVHRMLGNKQGSGGSSGYIYLKSTASDHFKVYLDIFNLSTWLLPKEYVTPLPKSEVLSWPQLMSHPQLWKAMEWFKLGVESATNVI